MYTHILVATDGSELAGKAVSAGLALGKVLKAKVTAVTVTEPWTTQVSGEMAFGFPLEQYDKATAENAAAILAAVSEVAKGQGGQCAILHVKDQFPAEGIVECAKQQGCDLIVMASHGRRGLSRLLLGSQTTRVLALGTVPVLVCR